MKADWKKFTSGKLVHSRNWYFEDWGFFAYSFKLSGDAVYAEFKRTRRDAFWFPAIFLYRQWLELALKSVWSEIANFDDSLGKVPWTHGLAELWAPVRAWFDQKEMISADDDYFVSAERIFPALDNIDPTGTAFRYPPTRLPHFEVLNFSLEDFENAIDQADTLFFGLFRMLDEYEQYLAFTTRSQSG